MLQWVYFFAGLGILSYDAVFKKLSVPRKYRSILEALRFRFSCFQRGFSSYITLFLGFELLSEKILCTTFKIKIKDFIECEMKKKNLRDIFRCEIYSNMLSQVCDQTDRSFGLFIQQAPEPFFFDNKKFLKIKFWSSFYKLYMTNACLS